jgi:predicted nucleotidyltransferase
MNLKEIQKVKQQLYEIASRHGIRKVYVFGSVARGESNDVSDVDFLIEMESEASAFGVGAFQYEAQQLLGTPIDVVPTFTLPNVDDKAFVNSVQSEAVAL